MIRKDDRHQVVGVVSAGSLLVAPDLARLPGLYTHVLITISIGSLPPFATNYIV